MVDRRTMQLAAAIFLAAFSPAPPLLAAPQAASAPPGAGLSRVDALADGAARVAGIAAARRLQIAYSQYAEFGLWDDMAGLFAKDATAHFGEKSVAGREAIARHLRQAWGGGRDGLAPGALHTLLPFTPVLNFDADGRTIHGRWHELGMLADAGGEARWTGGIYENDYVQEGGVWKIARLRYFPQFAGSYADGWRNVERDLKVVPLHYRPETAGLIAPPGAPRLARGSDIGAVDALLVELEQEQAVTNLQNVYGYYVDQKMWDDVTDLFEPDGVLAIAGAGRWTGAREIRRTLERDGPAGLKAGDLNNHVQLASIVTVSPSGDEARARGIDLGMTGANGAKAYWSTAIFENRYVRRDGIWRIAEMRIFPRMKADYALGWVKGRIVDPATAPTAPNAVLAFSYVNPGTGRLPRFAAGVAPVATTGAWRQAGSARPTPDVATLEARLRRVAAYEGAANASNAFGNYIDDFEWQDLGNLFARKGAREMPYAGFYIGPEHITKAEVVKWGPRKSPRLFIPIHLRTQPVINVAPDGRSAGIRTRLFSIGSGWDRASTFSGGMYPNDQAVLEDGTWKLWSVAIDEFYYNSGSYAKGWADVPHEPAEKKPDPLLAAYPPDVPLTALGKRQQGYIPGSSVLNPYVHNGPAYPGYPSAAPMWFSYRNPVSGRTPAYYWPDCVTCVARPETSLKANGY